MNILREKDQCNNTQTIMVSHVKSAISLANSERLLGVLVSLILSLRPLEMKILSDVCNNSFNYSCSDWIRTTQWR